MNNCNFFVAIPVWMCVGIICSPCVAQRVCPMPRCDIFTAFNQSNQISDFSRTFCYRKFSLLIAATPAESYPRSGGAILRAILKRIFGTDVTDNSTHKPLLFVKNGAISEKSLFKSRNIGTFRLSVLKVIEFHFHYLNAIAPGIIPTVNFFLNCVVEE